MHAPLSPHDRCALWVRLAIRGILIFLALLLIIKLGPPLCSLFAPFLLALLVAWALHPPVRWLHRKLGISRKGITMAVMILCYTAVGGMLYGAGYMLFTQVRSIIENWASIRQSLVDGLNTLFDALNHFSTLLPDSVASDANELAAKLLGLFQSVLPNALSVSLDSAGSFVTQVPSFFIAAVVFIMASYFITADYPRLRFLATDRLPVSLHEFGGNVRRIFREAFGGYLKSQLILSFGVFCILALGFTLIGQSYGLVLALLFAILDFIPIIGSGTIMIPWAVICLVLGDLRSAIELMVIWGIIAVFRRVAEPKILGDQTGLSPILSLIGIYVGMQLGGVLGMVFGPLILLVVINLWKLGTFDPLWSDLRLCAEDLNALLAASRHPKD